MIPRSAPGGEPSLGHCRHRASQILPRAHELRTRGVTSANRAGAQQAKHNRQGVARTGEPVTHRDLSVMTSPPDAVVIRCLACS